jgi:hypothetical protein
VHQHVGGRQNPRHVRAEAEKRHAGPEAGRGRTRLPCARLPADADDREIHVPRRIRAEALPRVEEHVEPLAPIAQRADKDGDW